MPSHLYRLLSFVLAAGLLISCGSPGWRTGQAADATRHADAASDSVPADASAPSATPSPSPTASLDYAARQAAIIPEPSSSAVPGNALATSTSAPSAPKRQQADLLLPTALIDAPIISQLPEFPNGCEITSLAMLTAFMGLPYNKEELEILLPKDDTPAEYDDNGILTQWGDPSVGFVGDIHGESIGYSVSSGPLQQVLDRVYPGGTDNLTGNGFEVLEQAVSAGRPVVVWTTEDFKPVREWTQWTTPFGEIVHAYWNIHAVLLVGYDRDSLYVNNPLNGEKAQQVDKAPFIEAWEQLGHQALTYKESIK